MSELLSVFGQRLSVLRGQRTVRDFARELGVHFNTLASYERGDGSPDLRFLTKISEVSGKPLSWLLGDDDHGVMALPTGTESQIVLPMYDVRASAGAGALVVSQDISEHFAVGRDWLRRNLPPWAPANSIVGVLEGSGDSMEPTIRDGDLIMVVQGVSWPVVERGGIFVFTLDQDRLLLKRLQVLNNGDLRIISDNKAYEADTVPFHEINGRVMIHGQVFFAGGKPRNY